MLHQVIVLLIVKALLPEAVAVEVVLRVSHCKLKAIAGVDKLIRENRPLTTLYL